VVNNATKNNGRKIFKSSLLKVSNLLKTSGNSFVYKKKKSQNTPSKFHIKVEASGTTPITTTADGIV
jgi:hypothetical protein